MGKQDYTATILVDETAKEAFDAIKDFREWWSKDIEGETGKINETFFYYYKDVHLSKIKLIEEVHETKLVYKILDNQFSFTKDKTEWIDSNLIFEISKEGDKTKITFTHRGLTPKDACYDICNEAWDHYIKKSLNQLIATGIGEPNPKEEDGFNAKIVEKWKLK